MDVRQKALDDAFSHDRFPGTQDSVRAHLVSLRRTARANGINPERSVDMLIVLGEVLNNIVEHAFRSREGWIDCRVRHSNEKLLIETSDNGRPLPPMLLVRSELPQTEVPRDELPEGGFGWFVIHSLVEDMVYERTSGENHLSFTIVSR